MIRYRSLSGYKYMLAELYMIQTKLRPGVYLHEPDAVESFVTLSPSGLLTIHAGYCWDGPSGPSIDTASFMRGSLVHDALYQLMRTGKLPQSKRKYADDLLRDICREDGMSSFRAWYVHRSVRMFAGFAARRQPEKSHEILGAP